MAVLEDLRRLPDRVRRHWRGESTLTEALANGLFLVPLPHKKYQQKTAMHQGLNTLISRFAFLILTAIQAPDVAGADDLAGVVIRVFDGGTVVFVELNDRSSRLRLAAIDVPESRMDFGKEATECLAAKVLN